MPKSNTASYDASRAGIAVASPTHNRTREARAGERHHAGVERFVRLLREAGIKGHRKPFHDLRHTFATDLLLARVPIFRVSRWLGHASIQIACDTYGHLLPDPDEHTIVDALDGLMADAAGHDLVTETPTESGRGRRRLTALMLGAAVGGGTSSSPVG